MSLYEKQLEVKIKRQKLEITRLLADNAELKKGREAIRDNAFEAGLIRGQEEAWELAQKIILPQSRGGMNDEDYKGVFGSSLVDGVIVNHTYAEAAAKVAEWERKKEEICVGDVLLSNETGNKCIVTRISNEVVTTLWDDGSCGDRPKDFVRGRFKKIGHIDVNTWLAQIDGEEE